MQKKLSKHLNESIEITDIATAFNAAIQRATPRVTRGQRKKEKAARKKVA